MKKRICLIAACILLLLCTACGIQVQAEEDYNGYSREELQEVCLGYLETLENIDPSEITKLVEDDKQEVPEILLSWQEIRPDLGEFQSYGDFEITRAGKTLMTEQTAVYENRPVLLTCVYDIRNMEMTDVTVERVYTMKERMSRAGMNTIMCISAVFAVLIIISLLIYAFKVFSVSGNRKKEEPEVKSSAAPAEDSGTLSGKKLAAVVAAAVAAETGRSADTFHITSVKKTDSEKA